MSNKKNTQDIFIERLKDLMLEHGLNQMSLSKETGIPQQTISGWLVGARMIKIDALCILADYFDVTTDYLLGREY